MNITVTPLIEQSAREHQLSICIDPFHSTQGIELRKYARNTDVVVGMGYYLRSLNEIVIYRSELSKRDIFCRTRLWFLWGWLIKPRKIDNQPRVLKTVTTAEFDERRFVERVKKEFAPVP